MVTKMPPITKTASTSLCSTRATFHNAAIGMTTTRAYKPTNLSIATETAIAILRRISATSNAITRYMSPPVDPINTWLKRRPASVIRNARKTEHSCPASVNSQRQRIAVIHWTIPCSTNAAASHGQFACTAPNTRKSKRPERTSHASRAPASVILNAVTTKRRLDIDLRLSTDLGQVSAVLLFSDAR